jgi:MoCo/4Fe-4S cofactor protein with predicted Tat translocation signal
MTDARNVSDPWAATTAAASTSDTVYWRSFEQLENSAEFQQLVATEFRKPKTTILPFNKRLGKGSSPACRVLRHELTRGGYGVSVLVKSSDGRPTRSRATPTIRTARRAACGELLQIYDPGGRAVIRPASARQTPRRRRRPAFLRRRRPIRTGYGAFYGFGKGRPSSGAWPSSCGSRTAAPACTS